MVQVEYQRQKREQHKYHLAMILILLLAFAFGANGLNYDPIWADELASITFMGVFDPPYSLSQVVESVRQYSPDHTPLYFFLGALWGQIAGWSQFSLRFLSLAAGVLMIAWLYRFAADVVNRRTAVIAALLMSTSAFAILYFHDIRMYTMLMCLGIVHSWLYWRLAHGFQITRLTWLLFILTTSLLFYTHNFAIILFAGLGIYHLVFVAKSRRWMQIIMGWSIGALSFLPYVPNVVDKLSRVSNSSPRAAPNAEMVEAFAQLLVNGLDILWLPLMLSLGYAFWRKRLLTMCGLLTMALTMIVALLIVSWRFEWISLDRMRYFLIVWVPLIILFAWGLTSLPRWFAITALFILSWSVAGYQYGQSTEILPYTGWVDRARRFAPLHEYVYHLKDKPRSQDYLVGFSLASGQVNKVHTQGGSTADYYLKVQLGIDGVFLETHFMRRLERDMRNALNDYAYILFAYNPENTPRNAVTALDIIREEFVPCAVLVNKPDLLVQRYVNPVLDCAREEYAPIEYDNGVRVVDRFARYVSEEQVVQILTGWEVPDEALLDEYNVSMQIITPDWRNVRQTDRHLYDNLLPWNVIGLPTEGLPPGDYNLMLILYHRDSGEKVSGLDLVSGEAGNILPLLTFTIGS